MSKTWPKNIFGTPVHVQSQRHGSIQIITRTQSLFCPFFNLCSTVQISGPGGLTFTLWGCYGLSPRHKPIELAHSFCSVLVSVSVYMALSTVFHSINSPDNSPLSHSVLLVLLCLTGPFNYISLYESLPQP